MMTQEQINRPLVLAEVTAAFYRYEEALVSNDIAVLDEHTTITTFGEDYAVCSTEFTREGSERIGRQQQTWVRFPCGWRIVAAHVSLMS